MQGRSTAVGAGRSGSQIAMRPSCTEVDSKVAPPFLWFCSSDGGLAEPYQGSDFVLLRQHEDADHPAGPSSLGWWVSPAHSGIANPHHHAVPGLATAQIAFLLGAAAHRNPSSAIGRHVRTVSILRASDSTELTLGHYPLVESSRTDGPLPASRAGPTIKPPRHRDCGGKQRTGADRRER